MYPVTHFNRHSKTQTTGIVAAICLISWSLTSHKSTSSLANICFKIPYSYIDSLFPYHHIVRDDTAIHNGMHFLFTYDLQNRAAIWTLACKTPNFLFMFLVWAFWWSAYYYSSSLAGFTTVYRKKEYLGYILSYRLYSLPYWLFWNTALAWYRILLIC